MVEDDWLRVGAEELLHAVQERATERRLLLFAVACCRRVWPLLSATLGQPVVEMIEQYADGTLACEALAARTAEVAQAALDRPADGQPDAQYWAQRHALAAVACGIRILEMRQPPPANPDRPPWHPLLTEARLAVAFAAPAAAWDQILEVERRAQDSLARDIFGVYCHETPSAADFPPLVLDLAAQLYNGVNTAPVLHDALVDAGQAEWAEHFREEPWHPKGCWVVDAILGKS